MNGNTRIVLPAGATGLDMHKRISHRSGGDRPALELPRERNRLAQCLVIALAVHVVFGFVLGSIKVVQALPWLAAAFQLMPAPPPPAPAPAGDPYAAYREFEYRPVRSTPAEAGHQAHIDWPATEPAVAPVTTVIGVLGGAPQRMGPARWFRVQLLGLALLPLVLWHFMTLGKIAKWLDWFHGVDTKPAPAGTLIIFVVGVLVIALRLLDAVRQAPIKSTRTKED